MFGNKQFLVATAVVEAGAGLALLLVPPVFFDLLIAIPQPSPEALLVGRVGGLALLALAVSCWHARDDGGGSAPHGLLCGMLVYNVGVGLLLAYAGSMLQMAGIALWPAVALHGAMAIWGVTRLKAPREAL